MSEVRLSGYVSQGHKYLKQEVKVNGLINGK